MSNSTSLTRKVFILGAGGYLGSALCQFFHAMPLCHVVAVFRRTPNHRSFCDHFVADVFADEWSEKISSGSVVINCAFDFASVGKDDIKKKFAIFKTNIAALYRHDPIRLINISTMSAYPNCRSDYGREKLYVENLFSKYGGINVRPGLIASWRRPGAAFLSLINIVKRSKIVPTLTARNSGFYFCDLEAVLLGIDQLIRINLNKPHTVSFCYRKRLSLFEVLRAIEGRLGVSRLKIPVPWRAVYLLLRAKEALIGKSKVRADSIIDFAYPTHAAFRREYFSRLIEEHRHDLESVSSAGKNFDGFYFLEGEKSPRRQRSYDKNNSNEAGLAILSQLSDTHGVG